MSGKTDAILAVHEVGFAFEFLVWHANAASAIEFSFKDPSLFKRMRKQAEKFLSALRAVEEAVAAEAENAEAIEGLAMATIYTGLVAQTRKGSKAPDPERPTPFLSVELLRAWTPEKDNASSHIHKAITEALAYDVEACRRRLTIDAEQKGGAA